MVFKAYKNVADASRAEVGEIDTSAPFESVKAAVSLFGEVAFSPEKSTVTLRKPKSQETESPLVKETQLHLAQKELNKFKEQLKNCEKTRIQALGELENAKKIVEELSQKLKTINESRESAIEVAESARIQTKKLEEISTIGHDESIGSWKLEVESAREQYVAAATELDVAKQELRRIRKDFEASMDAKVSAVQQEAEAKQLGQFNNERIDQLSKEIASIEESIMQVKLASMQTKQDESDILAEKDAYQQSYKLALDETEWKLASLRKEFDPEQAANLEMQLARTTTEIGVLKKELENARGSDLDSVTIVTSELDSAKANLLKVAEEESSLRSLLESLKLELDNVRKDHLKLKEMELETESLAGDLNVKLQKSKAELKTATAEETKARAACDDLRLALQQLSIESENARKDAEMMERNAEDVRKEAESAQITVDDVEKQLHAALIEAEEAKAAEAHALTQMKVLSEKASLSRTLTSESGATITISSEEFESLSQKAKESETLAEMKVTAAMMQIEAVKTSENESIKKLEACRIEMEGLELATEEALKRAEMAEAARMAVEVEMKRWRDKEQKSALEAATRILVETKIPPIRATLPKVRVPKPSPPPPDKLSGGNVAARNAPTTMSRMADLSGIFSRKKNQAEGGSPSYFSAEKPGLLGVLD